MSQKKAPSEKSLKELAQDKLNNGNASQLGDPVSLKAETADSEPTENDRGAKGAQPARKTTSGEKQAGGAEGQGTEKKKKTLSELAMENPSMLGDPVSMKAETSDTEPTENDRGALSNNPQGYKPKDSKL